MLSQKVSLMLGKGMSILFRVLRLRYVKLVPIYQVSAVLTICYSYSMGKSRAINLLFILKNMMRDVILRRLRGLEFHIHCQVILLLSSSSAVFSQRSCTSLSPQLVSS